LAAKSIFKAIFQPDFQVNFERPLASNQAPRFCRRHPKSEWRGGGKLDGSFRICMGPMSFRKGNNRVPCCLLAATFVNINEHFIRK
jgi:hypothetical protein